MYEPLHFKVEDRQKLFDVIAANPLALLVSSGAQGLLANAIPFQCHPELCHHGVLRAHVARANSQWRDLVGGLEVLVVFQGVERYISPSLYASKQAHGKVVPTWNYVMVQARGKAMVQEDAPWLRRQSSRLTDTHEAMRAEPWAVDDAPPDFVSAQMRAIVGIEIEISDLRGKFKVSQNRAPQDRASVLGALEASSNGDDLVMADLLRQSMAGD